MIKNKKENEVLKHFVTMKFNKHMLIFLISGGSSISKGATNSKSPSNQVCYSSDGDSDEGLVMSILMMTMWNGVPQEGKRLRA